MSEGNLHFDDQSKQVDSLVFVAVFSNIPCEQSLLRPSREDRRRLCLQGISKEIETTFSVMLFSHRNTRESLGELEKAVETLTYGARSLTISHSPKLPLMFLQLDRNIVHIFYFQN